MNAAIESMVIAAKMTKAERAFDAGVESYGSVTDRLKSLDCRTRDEAVKMLAKVQTVRIYKANGKVVVE